MFCVNNCTIVSRLRLIVAPHCIPKINVNLKGKSLSTFHVPDLLDEIMIQIINNYVKFQKSWQCWPSMQEFLVKVSMYIQIKTYEVFKVIVLWIDNL